MRVREEPLRIRADDTYLTLISREELTFIMWRTMILAMIDFVREQGMFYAWSFAAAEVGVGQVAHGILSDASRKPGMSLTKT